MIIQKAKSLCEDLKSEHDKTLEWKILLLIKDCLRFKRHHSLYNIKVSGDAVSVDTTAAGNYPELLKKVVKEGRYTPQQI